MEEIKNNIKIPRRKIKAAINDIEKCADIVNLVHTTDDTPGYKRMHNRKDFYYLTDKEERLTDEVELQRIKKLVIPPALEKVWISKTPHSHLQATGIDQKNRKQYLYHPSWRIIRSQTKFFQMLEFGKQLPLIRLQLEKDLALPGFPQEKVLAAIVSLLEQTNIRIGNSFYEKLYGSYGLTTMKNRHVAVKGSHIQFTFKGKKGIKHHITLTSRKLASIIKACKDIPGRELFEYYDERQNVHSVDSGKVNSYIQKITGQQFTAKDFRTWAGSIEAFLTLKELGVYSTETEMKQKIITTLDTVAKALGNTRAVSRKYYVHPKIIELYMSNKLDKYNKELNSTDKTKKNELLPEEKIFMKLLETT